MGEDERPVFQLSSKGSPHLCCAVIVWAEAIIGGGAEVDLVDSPAHLSHAINDWSAQAAGIGEYSTGGDVMLSELEDAAAGDGHCVGFAEAYEWEDAVPCADGNDGFISMSGGGQVYACYWGGIDKRWGHRHRFLDDG